MSVHAQYTTVVICSIVALLSLAVLAYCEFVATPNLEKEVQTLEVPKAIVKKTFFNPSASIPDTGMPMDGDGVDTADDAQRAIDILHALREEEFAKYRIADKNFLSHNTWIRTCMKVRFTSSLKTYETVRMECEKGIE